MSSTLAGLTVGVVTLGPNTRHPRSLPTRRTRSSPCSGSSHKTVVSSTTASDKAGRDPHDRTAPSDLQDSALYSGSGKTAWVTGSNPSSRLEGGRTWRASCNSSVPGSKDTSVTSPQSRLFCGSVSKVSESLCDVEAERCEPVFRSSPSVGHNQPVTELTSGVREVSRPPQNSGSSPSCGYPSTKASNIAQRTPPRLTMVVGSRDHLPAGEPPDLHVKLILLGDYSVGKSSLLRVLGRQSLMLSREKEQRERGDCSNSSNSSCSSGGSGSGSSSVWQSGSVVSRASSRSCSSGGSGRRAVSPLWESGTWMLVSSCLQPGEFVEVEFLHGNKRVLARVADTGGQERYRSMTTSYYRGAHGCLLMFDVTKEESFDNLDTWIENIDRYKTDEEMPCILVGTKSKSPARRIHYDRASKYAESRGLPYMELDMDHMTDIRRVFEALLDSVTVRINKLSRIAISIRPDISASKDVVVKKHVSCAC